MIKPKKGKCIDCPEDKPEQWLAKNKPPLCRYCNEKRKALKKKEGGKAPYRYIRKATGELDLFRMLSETREHKSEVNGEPIPNLTPSNFAHILPKGLGKFPLFKLEPRNILIMTREQHHEWDNGSRTKLRLDPDWDKVFKLEDELKREYEELLSKMKIG